jgi:hypothetical protein
MVLFEALAGALLGLLALWLVLRPLMRPMAPAAPVFEPLDPEETPKGVALSALKEIEFDRETGKLSDADYEMLKAKYTAAALEALRVADGDAQEPRASTSQGTVICSHCGPRLEPDARFCSTCGRPLSHRAAA